MRTNVMHRVSDPYAYGVFGFSQEASTTDEPAIFLLVTCSTRHEAAGHAVRIPKHVGPIDRCEVQVLSDYDREMIELTMMMRDQFEGARDHARYQ